MTMPCYVDASVIVGLLLGESKSAKYQGIFDACDEIISSFLLEAEVLAAARREEVSLRKASAVVDAIHMINPEERLSIEYQRVLQAGYCKGSDLHHIATALFCDPTMKQLGFVTTDKRQAHMARTVGFEVL